MSAPAMTKTQEEIQREQQVRQAEELLFSGLRRRSLAKELFQGRLAADLVFPYPQLSEKEQPKVAVALRDLKVFCDESLDPAEIDRARTFPARSSMGSADWVCWA